MMKEPQEWDLDRLGEEARWEVLARYAAAESGPGEVESVESWLAADPARGVLLQTLRRAIDAVEFEVPADLDVESALSRVKRALDGPVVVPIETAHRAKAWRPAWRLLRVAAVMVGVVAGSVVWRTLRTDPSDAPGTLTAATWQTPVGRADTVILADGSRVILAPQSRMVVDGEAANGERVVELAGQALFDVVHDAERPFTVRTATATIQDLGTTFSVRSDGEDGVQVAVLSGSVMLRAAGGGDEGVTLHAGDRGVSVNGASSAIRGAATDDDVAWSSGRLVFDDAPLARVRSDLRRWYGIELRVTDDTLEGRHLTATFEGESADEVLNVIGLSMGARVERRGDTAFVSMRPAGPAR